MVGKVVGKMVGKMVVRMVGGVVLVVDWGIRANQRSGALGADKHRRSERAAQKAARTTFDVLKALWSVI